MADVNIRDRVLAALSSEFGRPRVVASDEGNLYRWILERPPDQPIYVTLNSPERHDLAHVLLSDHREHANPIASFMLRSPEEADSLIHRIVRQWSRSGSTSGTRRDA